MNRLSRILRATLRYLGYGLAVLLVVLVALVGFVGFTDTGARMAVSYGEKIAAASGQVISISEPSGLLTGKLRASAITLGDEKGTYAEIRDLANKMMHLCKEAAPALFEDAGPSCVSLGYCPENEFQHPSCRIIRKKEALEILRNASKQS